MQEESDRLDELLRIAFAAGLPEPEYDADDAPPEEVPSDLRARILEQARLLSTELRAITDVLTGLFNRRYLHEALERTLERCRRDGQPLAVIMLEIDNFKRYNDTYGHMRGDKVLRIVADLLRKGSRALDIVARYGGDEFMIMLPNTSKHTASEIAERLRSAVEAYPLQLGENIVTSVTLSVGVAANPEDGDTVCVLVYAVDRTLYTAKRSGGNKVYMAHARGGFPHD